jgi:transposase InsO family protein
MAWKEVSTMSLREEFVRLAAQGAVSFKELCERYEISRKTGYKWLKRHASQGSGGLMDLSRRPHSFPQQLSESEEKPIIQWREQHRMWGARKIQRLLKEHAVKRVPATSTITRVFHRHGLMEVESKVPTQKWQRFEHPVPNSLWQMDFKGPVNTLAGKAHPLTVLDDHSRFNLCLQALPNEQTAGVKDTLTDTFCRYGLPDRIAVDNGGPWGSDAEHPYTPLTVWLIRLGVSVSHSRPYHPQTLGKDERFHGTLKRELLSRRQWQDRSDLQRSLDPWREEYNWIRPHEALGLAVPGSRYKPSLRSFPEKLQPLEYPNALYVRKVQQGGAFSLQGHTLWVSKAFAGYPIGLIPTTTDGVLEVRFCHQKIALVNLRESDSSNTN